MERLTADVFRTMAQAAAVQLEAEKVRVDALNVFPVPDGDTGTNMALTLWAAADAVLSSRSTSLGELAECAAQAALMGARGNSGVILSQFLRGFADGVKGLDDAGPLELAQALIKAAESAYGAVIRPIEGTVLTVGKEAAREAARIAQKGGNLLSVLEGALVEAMETLARTPELLETLREAGVVDAGGEGLVVAARGAFQAIHNGRQEYPNVLPSMPLPQDEPRPSQAVPAEQEILKHPATGIEESQITYRYCTEFLVRGEDICQEGIRRDLSDLGDSLLVVGQKDVVKVHVHTNHPGLALELCGVRGELLNIHINNMEEQNRLASKRHEIAEQAVSQKTIEPQAPAADVAVVTVASGSGCVELLRSLGAAAVVEGGQTMNPSTQELLTAIQNTRARSALVLPNNGNVLMSARQAGHLAGIPVAVVPTRSFCQGVAALLRFAPEQSLSENAKLMEEAIDSVACGEVTVAVRDAYVDSKEVRVGDYLGIGGKKILVSGEDRDEVTTNLVNMLTTEESSLVTLYYGQDVDKKEAEGLAERIGEHLGLEVEVYEGGQPVYLFLISVE